MAEGKEFLDGILKVLVEKHASDLHMKPGSPPLIRIDGLLYPMKGRELTAQDTDSMAQAVTGDKYHILTEKGEIDLAYSLSGVGRFRFNIFKQRGSYSHVARHVKLEKSSLEDLGLPSVIQRLADEPRGLILVTGTAGSGKSTTLAGMLHHINETRRCHIITLEDPIEYLFHDHTSIVNQREIGLDSESFSSALKHVVRQDPNVIMIGEMRDMETIGIALTAAEIGNLVLSTLHTADASESINRIIDYFPAHQQKQVRLQMASTLRGVISQRLVPKVGGGRIALVEILIGTYTIRECIADAEQTIKIANEIESGEYEGMQSFDQHMIQLIMDNVISYETALQVTNNPHNFRLKAKQAGLDIA